MSIRASVVIPTKDAGELFKRVINAVIEQETGWQFEIVVIDSGSSDGTVEYCRTLAGVRLHQIRPDEFGHGRTRNLGAHLTSGDFIVFITHDALPVDRSWLKNLVAAAEQAPDVAGAFGRHLPYPEADPLLQRDLRLHFDNFLNWPAVFRLGDPERYQEDEGYRQVLHFFSDNNACVRRSVWKSIPYPDVEFAEDQIWAKAAIEAGYGKAYADNARVYHSHNYNVVELMRRSFDESSALFRLFGYRLCGSLSQLLAQAWARTIRDYRYLGKRALVKAPGWLVRIPLRNFSQQLGYYLGPKAENCLYIENMISLDRSKRTRPARPDSGTVR